MSVERGESSDKMSLIVIWEFVILENIGAS